MTKATAKAKEQTKVSARDRYAVLREEHLTKVAQKLEEILRSPLAEGEQTYSFTSPSGMEWELRKLNPMVFANVGVIPNELAVKLTVLKKEGASDADILSRFSSKDVDRSIEFNSTAVRYICVNPRIVETPTADDEIGFDEVVRADYDALLKWATSGGGEAERLGNFPRK